MTHRNALSLLLVLGVSAGATTRAQEAAAPLAGVDAPRLAARLAPITEERRRSRPEWVEARRGSGLRGAETAVATGPVRLVLHEGRADGPDTLTLRRVFGDDRRIRAYCGAGLHQAVYFEEAATGPTVFDWRARQRSLGAAAELGTELRLGERLRLDAGLRWAGLAGDAVVLRTDRGLVAADPLSATVAFGWQFR